MRHNHRPGYTLLEVILVVALLGIIAAVATPLLENMYGGSKLNAAADMVKARLADARGKAKEEGRPYRFAVMHNSGSCRVEPDIDDLNGPSSGDKSTCIEDKLPAEIKFAVKEGGSGDSGEFATVVVFLPDGTAREDAEVSFGGQGNRSLVLRVRASTGAVTTSENTEPSQP